MPEVSDTLYLRKNGGNYCKKFYAHKKVKINFFFCNKNYILPDENANYKLYNFIVTLTSSSDHL